MENSVQNVNRANTTLTPTPDQTISDSPRNFVPIPASASLEPGEQPDALSAELDPQLVVLRNQQVDALAQLVDAVLLVELLDRHAALVPADPAGRPQRLRTR